MPTIHLEAQVSTRDLLRAIAELSPPDLDPFLADVVALREQRVGRLAAATDDELLEQVRNAYPEDLRQRYRDLNAKRRAETLTPEEHAELLRLTDAVESRNAERVQALLQLALRRQKSLEAVMQELGIQPPPYE